MQNTHKKIELFGKPFLQKLILKPPFVFNFPVEERACFLYVLQGDMQFRYNDDETHVPTNQSLLLNCLQSGKQLTNTTNSTAGEVVVVTFHPEILRKIYDKELPAIVKPGNAISNQTYGTINNDFLIRKYIEGLLFYFDNPALVNEEILALKLKEIILLLSQTQQFATVQIILSQLFSPQKFSFQQIIEAHLFSQLSVDELAQKTNLSVSSFKREFLKVYNDSPASYIKNKKLDKAATLLIASDNRIADIAFDCGFNDLANFTKSFHDKYGVSPTNYRLNQITK